MRLKQLLVVLLLLLVMSGVAAMAAGVPQLSKVSVVGQGKGTVVTLHANGTFTHNDYRPSDNLLLVDLAGVSAGSLHDRVRAVDAPGVKSYHVVGYTGAGGVSIARLELTLVGRPEVHISEVKDGLAVEVVPTGDAATAEPSNSAPSAPAPAPAAKPVKAAVEPAPSSAAAPGLVKVSNVAVVRGSDGIEVEITASAPITGTTTVLTNPDRLVLDVPDSVPAARPRPIAVNAGGVRSVRMGQFQANPPITRVVVDLAEAHEFDLVGAGNKLTLKLRSSAPAPVVAAQPRQATPAVSSPRPAPKPAAELKLAKATVEPEYKGSEQGAAKDFAVVSQPRITERTGNSPDPQPDPARLMAANTAPVSTPAMTQPLAPQVAQAAPAQVPAPQAAPPVPSTVQHGVNFAAEQRQQGGHGATLQGPKYTGEPISVNLKDVDLKDFFRLIHEISGLNIVLDPSVAGSLTLVLDDVPWDQALDIVLKNNNLDRQLEGNVLRIATVDTLRKEADSRRKQVEAQALAVEKVTATRFLSYAHAKDVLPTMKRMLSARGEIVADERTNALIITDIPNVIGPIDNLILQLDRKTQEVEIEARVIAATRSFARDIGTQLGFGWGNSATSVGGAPNQTIGDSPTQIGYFGAPPYVTSPGVPFSPLGTIKSTAASIPLFSNLPALGPTSGLNLVNLGGAYRVDAVLTMAESRGLLKILSRPRVITQNNIQAIVKQGQRVPITTQAQLGGPPTTTYMEAVLRLTVTPQITAEGTIFLNIDIENTTPDFSNRVNGNPVFLTQQATTQVLVTNGGTVVVGGVLQSQNSININQIPLLGSVPILGNLFKRRGVNTATQELIFFITPRIIEM